MRLPTQNPSRAWHSLFCLALVGLTACGGSTKSEGQVDSQTGNPARADSGTATGGSAGTLTGSGAADPRPGGAAGAPVPGAGGTVAPGRGGTSGVGGASPSVGGSGGIALPALGGSAGSGGAEAGGGGNGGSGGLPGVGGSAGSGGLPRTCNDAAAELEALIPDTQACTAVVRLAYAGGDPLAYQLICGDPRAEVTEAQARTYATLNTGFDFSSAYLESDPEQDWLFSFEVPPGDFGAVAVVSAYTGLVVFGGGVVWSGAGDIVFPASWRPASDLGECVPPDLVPTPRGIGPAYLSFDMMTPVERVWSTALPVAMNLQAASFQNVAVMFYPRTVGELDLSTAEFVVFVNWDWV